MKSEARNSESETNPNFQMFKRVFGYLNFGC